VDTTPTAQKPLLLRDKGSRQQQVFFECWNGQSVERMKNIVHFFAREVVLELLNSIKEPSARNFEFFAAALMQRIYERQWGATVIGFYMNREYARLLEQMERSGSLDYGLLIDALTNGIMEDHQIDFVIATASDERDQKFHQEFQLKRFGMRGQQNTTEGLVAYLNSLKRKYTRTDAACLIALTQIGKIDLPKVRDEFDRDGFPFTELLLIGLFEDKFVVAGLLPAEGWSTYNVNEIVH
jgi:hypothetical protein